MPDVTYHPSEPTAWRSLDGDENATFDGRLIGGCLDTLAPIAASPHGDVRRFIAEHGSRDGVVLYLENAELSPTALVRALHTLRWAGWLDGLAGLLIGRSAAPDSTQPSQLRDAQALADTLGALRRPVLLGADIGHRPPQMLLINGALASVAWSAAGGASLHATPGLTPAAR